MDRRKKLSRKRVMVPISTTESPNESISEDDTNIDQWKFVTKIYLSPSTQIFLGCRIGDQITFENQWVHIDKKRIELDFRINGTNSELAPLKKEILFYPETDILFGTTSYILDKKVEFCVCTTIEMRSQVLSIMQKRKENIIKHIKEMRCPESKPWISLGSEEEVHGDMNINGRLLFEILLHTVSPLVQKKVVFRLCPVEECQTGYVEALPRQNSLKFILKKCVDKSTQGVSLKLNKKLQIIIPNAANKSTQYSYNCPEIEETTILTQKISKFILENNDNLCNNLINNYYVNTSADDYSVLIKSSQLIIAHIPTELRSYREAIYCKGKKISSLSWNAHISGLVAVSYVKDTYFCVNRKKSVESMNNIWETNLVLIWSYDDNVRPKLYLYANRDVTALSFCPYDENILVGGCSNGQILVWDISNRLKTSNYSSNLKNIQNFRLEEYTTWFKRPLGDKHLFPVLISPLKESHSSDVTSIAWIPSSHYISKSGKFKKCVLEDHMQFLTASLSGVRILVHDLGISKQLLNQYADKKRICCNRLSKIPDALLLNVSKLKRLQGDFVPKYILCLKKINNLGPCSPITHIVMKNQEYCYSLNKGQTVSKFDSVTHIALVDLLQPFIPSRNILCSTGLGALHTISWQGLEFNQQQKNHTEECKIVILKTVHDGPITACHTNLYFPNLVLTVGGTVFAIWETARTQVPLCWRKSKFRLISGMWLYPHPLTLIVIRADNYCDHWNLYTNSSNPLRSYKYKGSTVEQLYAEPTRIHSRKGSFITTNILGSFKVLSFPLRENLKLPDSELIETLDFINRSITIRNNVELLKLTMKETNEAEEKLKSKFPEVQVAHKERLILTPKIMTRELPLNHWQRKQELHMYNSLLAQKGFKSKDIMHLYNYRESAKRSKKEKEDKEANFLESQFKVRQYVDNIWSALLPKPFHIRNKVTVTFPEDVRVNMKKMYLDNYLELEKNMVKGIKEQSYKHTFNWSQMITVGKKKKKRHFSSEKF